MNDYVFQKDFVGRTMDRIRTYEERRLAARIGTRLASSEIVIKAGAVGGALLGLFSTARLFAMAFSPAVCG